MHQLLWNNHPGKIWRNNSKNLKKNYSFSALRINRWNVLFVLAATVLKIMLWSVAYRATSRLELANTEQQRAEEQLQFVVVRRLCVCVFFLNSNACSNMVQVCMSSSIGPIRYLWRVKVSHMRGIERKTGGQTRDERCETIVWRGFSPVRSITRL